MVYLYTFTIKTQSNVGYIYRLHTDSILFVYVFVVASKNSNGESFGEI